MFVNVLVFGSLLYVYAPTESLSLHAQNRSALIRLTSVRAEAKIDFSMTHIEHLP